MTDTWTAEDILAGKPEPVSGLRDRRVYEALAHPDREKARAVVDALSPEAAYVDEFVYDGDVAPLVDAVAVALAEEREKARAPFLALAEDLERTLWICRSERLFVADSIRRVVEETE